MTTDDVQHEARALGDPTRYRLFRYIANATEPVGVAELTNEVQLNHNAVRQHLAILKDAGLVLDELEERVSAGRPRYLYRLSPEATSRWTSGGPYAWLATQLSAALRSQVDAREIGRRSGIERGRARVGHEESTSVIERDLVEGGFRPSRRDRGQRVDFVLGRCPFVDVATENPGVVCQLHLGLAEGLAASLGDVTVERLSAKDPRRGGCRLVLQREHAARLATTATPLDPPGRAARTSN